MDGEIWADSKYGYGSTFSFNFKPKQIMKKEKQELGDFESDEDLPHNRIETFRQ